MFAVGSYTPNNVKAEIYQFETGQWTEVADYPFDDDQIAYAPVVHSNNGFIVFGGVISTTDYGRIVARFDMETREWSQVGALNNGRYGHGAIEIDSSFLIIGGYGEYLTEKCINNGENVIECSNQKPSLYKYYSHPELFYVPSNYCM